MLSYADLIAQFAPAPFMDADGIWQTPNTGTVNVPGLGDVIFIPRGYTGPAPLFTDPATGESYWLMPAPDGSIAFEFIPHAKDGFLNSPLFLLILAAAAVYTGGLAVASYEAAAAGAVASGAVPAATATMIEEAAAYAAWAGGDAATVAAVTAYEAGLSAEAIAAAAQAAAGGVTEVASSVFQFGDTIVELPAPTIADIPPLTLEPFPIGTPYTIGMPDITQTIAKTITQAVTQGVTAPTAGAAVTVATGGALTTAGGLLTTAATIAKMIKGASTPQNPGVNPATGLPWTVDTRPANAQSISQMLPWLAIAAFGVIAMKGKK